MPTPTNTLLIEGSFEELADELAHYLDEVQKRQNESAATAQAEITPLLEQGQKDEVLKKLVIASTILSSAPEKGTNHSTLWVFALCLTDIKANRVHRRLQPPYSPYPPVAQP